MPPFKIPIIERGMETKAFEKVTSPEELDKRLIVVGSKGWIALALTGMLVLGLVIWAFFGVIPNTYETKTIFLNEQGFEIVRSQIAGSVTEARVAVNSTVEPGQELLTVTAQEEKKWVAKASHKGKVVDFYATVGSHIDAGDPLLLIQRGEGNFLFFAFIPIERGSDIKSGTKVYIKPEGVNAQKYGSVEAIVKSVSPYVASRNELLNLLGNPALIDYFTENQPTMIVAIEPLKDAHTASGLKWTSGLGPPEPIPPQNVGTALFVLNARAPISYVTPIWRMNP